ncbi:MAG: DUF1080 domain-containing protein [Anaerolineae bacterium]|nr:DUF1080 domain-containing protein [Anaerolineae bacterium]
MRRAVLPVVLLIIFLTLLGLNSQMVNWHYVLSGDPGTVLYTATFDDFTDDWKQYEGRLEAAVADGVLSLQSNTAGSGSYSETRQYFDDFDLRVEARAVGGPLNNGYGVIFRLQDKGNESFADDSYYLFLVSSDGYYQVRRVEDGNDVILSAWIPSDVVRMGAAPDAESNWLRVIAQGDQFRFFVNGEPMQVCVPDSPDGVSTYDDINGVCLGQMQDALVDDKIGYGQIGVGIQSFDEPGVTVEFDNILITAPESQIE